MKYIVIFLLILSGFIVTSCNNSSKKEKKKDIVVQTTHKATIKCIVDTDGTIINLTSLKEDYNISYVIYTLNGCEYIKFENYPGYWGSHSGTCPNPIHQNKPGQISTDTLTIN